MRVTKFGVALVVVAALGACSEKSDKLINISRKQTGPDEFAILPTKPIEMPPSFSELPPPTPGGANRTDPTPNADAVAALGGNPARLTPTGRVTADGALVQAAGRYGVDPGIRPELAAADEEFRQKNKGKVLERLFRLTRYYSVYADQSLDQHGELRRYRQAGARTPGAPPDPALAD